MPQGIVTEIAGEVAKITPARELAGSVVAALLEAAGDPRKVRIDTGGTGRTYITSTAIARAAGLVDEPAALDDVAPVAVDVKPKRSTTRRKAAVE